MSRAPLAGVAVLELTELGPVMSARTVDESAAVIGTFDVDDILDDVTDRERGDVVTDPDDELGPVRMQAVLPHIHTDPGAVWRTGAPLGADNDLVYRVRLGLEDDVVAQVTERETS